MRAIEFIICLVLFSAFVYALGVLYRKQNGGLYPWQEPASSTPPTPGSRPTGTTDPK